MPVTPAQAGTFDNVFYSSTVTLDASVNGGGSYDTTFDSRTDGVDHNVASFTKTFSFTDIGTGVSFDVELNVAGGDGNLSNFGSPTFSYGIDNGSVADNNAIDLLGESVTFTVGTITQTGGPTADSITFDGFTGISVYFSSDSSDAGALTDGSSDLWSFDGELGTNPAVNADPAGVKVLGNSTDDSLFDWFGLRQHAHAQVDVSSFLPSTLVAEFRTGTDLSGDNRWRVDDVAAQFTVVVVPEPTAFALAGLGLAGLVIFRRRG